MRSGTAAGIAIGIVALGLSSCAWKSDLNAAQAENQQLKAQLSQTQAQLQQSQAQVSQLQTQLAQSKAEQNFVEAEDALFSPGSYELGPAGQAELSNNIIPKLKSYKDVKIVVYGYTDNAPVGRQLKAKGVPDNLVLSTRRASTVANYLVSQGINPNIVSAKGFGDTHPVASNDTPEGRAQNRRIVITVQGPGAS
jgi:chemotaxis protein MotB